MTTCPFCNAEISAETTRQAACPRCGEVVPSAGNHAVTNEVESPSSEERPPNSRIALLVVGAMIMMATLGLVFALNTIEHRRSVDTRGQEKEGPAAATIVKPADLTGLGYVPADTHVLLGLHVAQLRENLAGRAILERLEIPAELLPLEWTEHILVSLNMNALPPRVTAIFRGLHPIRRSNVGNTVRKGRSLERVTLARWKSDAFVTLADNHTTIACQVPEDFDSVPSSLQAGVDHLTQLKALMTERLDPKAVVWLVGQIEPDNTTLPVLAALIRIPGLENLRAVSLAFRADGADLNATLDVKGRDAAATAALADWIERSLGAAGVVAERTKDGDWQRLTANLTAESIAKWSK